MRHDHDGGFAADLPSLLGRRHLLMLLGGAGAAALAARPAMALDCTALPWETAGPYPADGTNSRAGQVINVLTEAGVLRDDLRPSFAGRTGTADGVALTLEITLLNADGCAPLAGHAIYVWHCDALGKYSLYDLPDQNFLRGVGVSDADGRVRFTTVVPGCYDGRWPHIHFEVFADAAAAVSGQAALLTAQMAMPQAEMAAVYATDARYANGTANLGRITLARDNVFGDNSAAELAQQTPALTGSPADGYAATIAIPVDMTAERKAQMAPPPPGGPGGPPPGAPPGPPPSN